MSTRSFVGKLNNDGTVRAIYVHHDGYLDGVGAVLIENYNDEETIDKLLDLGDMSVLGLTPVATWSEYPEPLDLEMCQTYRERGEEGVDAKVYDSVEDFLTNCCEEFTYLYKDGSWFFRQWSEETLRLVTDGYEDEN